MNKLLQIVLQAATALRTERDLRTVEARLGLLDRLSPDSHSGNVPARRALEAFVRDCSAASDRATKDWCAKTLVRCGIAYEDLRVHAAANNFSDQDYAPAVARFEPVRANYVWIPTVSLPKFCNPSGRGHLHVFDEALAREREDDGHWRRRLRRKVRSTGVATSPDPEELCGAALQDRILAKELPLCRAHSHVDWRIVLEAARDIHISTQPWDKETVRERIDLHRLPASSNHMDRYPEQERSVLRSLFFVPLQWDRRDTRVANGQHRICGMRAAGVELALVNII